MMDSQENGNQRTASKPEFQYREVYCGLCDAWGHINYSCTDLWMSYYATTQAAAPNENSNSTALPGNRQWCSGCARQGHLEPECHIYKNEHPPLATPYAAQEEKVSVQLDHHDEIPSSSFMSLSLSATGPSFYGPEGTSFLLPGRNPPVRVSSLPNSMQRLTSRDNVDVPRDHVVKVSNNFYLRKTFCIDGKEYTVTDNPKIIKKFIMTSSMKNVQDFLCDELSELEILADHSDLAAMRTKLHRYRECIDSPPVLQAGERWKKRFFFRTMNMIIFGVHGLWDGQQQVNVLNSFVKDSKMSDRESLYTAYSEIFGFDKRSLNYFETTDMILERMLKH